MPSMQEEPFKLISLSSDFGVQSQGVGAMEAAIFEIAPRIRVIHLMHGLPEFQIMAAARTLETLDTWPRGYHVCVCDPGVGTERHALAMQVGRGDYLIGPDNGVLIPASRILGGIRKVVALENPNYMREEVSPIFHGRDVFAPAAAHLSNGVKLEELGRVLHREELVAAPYEEATLSSSTVDAQIIQINRFGSVHLNIRHKVWDGLHFEHGDMVHFSTKGGQQFSAQYGRTFGDVPTGDQVVLRDDYGRVEVAVNMGRMCDLYGLQIGDPVKIQLP